MRGVCRTRLSIPSSIGQTGWSAMVMLSMPMVHHITAKRLQFGKSRWDEMVEGMDQQAVQLCSWVCGIENVLTTSFTGRQSGAHCMMHACQTVKPKDRVNRTEVKDEKAYRDCSHRSMRRSSLCRAAYACIFPMSCVFIFFKVCAHRLTIHDHNCVFLENDDRARSMTVGVSEIGPSRRHSP